MTTNSHLECGFCGRRYDAGRIYNLCACGGPLLVRYDLVRARQNWSRDWIPHGPNSQWRYAPVMPVTRPGSLVSLGEGMTPLVRVRRLGERLGVPELYVKDEGRNPTGSFKARGLSCAVSMMKELGVTKAAMPSAGNAAAALAAYAAAAGIQAQVFLPRDVPAANYVECVSYGARVTLVEGTISDCSRAMRQMLDAEEWFDAGTLREPYRLEGKKTMGYEIAEQLHWRMPEAILYPTGGGVGLLGIWKAFEEMQVLGWIEGPPPKLFAVQAAGCQPLVRAFEQGAERAEPWPDPFTVSSGLRVPEPLGDRLILKAVRESGGACIAVRDEAAIDAGVELAALEGVFACPEGAACIAALPRLVSEGRIRAGDRVVVLNTATGLKYLEAYSTRFPRFAALETSLLGGLITPR